MIKKTLLIFFYCFSVLFSQLEDTANDNIIKFSALDLLTGYYYSSSTIQFGFEKGVSNDISINTEIGFSFHVNRKPEFFMINLKSSSGFAFESEIRKYIDVSTFNYTGQYFSVDFLYRYLDAKKEHSVESIIKDTQPELSNNIIEEYSIFRNEFAIHVKYGYQSISVAGFTADFSAGVGLRYISSRTVSANPIAVTEYEFSYHKPFGEGSQYFFSGTVAIKIGWSLK
ncbi:MAG: hypothetical protein V1720_11535 [bacterium]